MNSEFDKRSFDVVGNITSQLKKIFPECFTEGKINFDKFKMSLGEIINLDNEMYSFSWAGRSETFKNIQAPSIGTLIADKKESINFEDTENLVIEGDNLEILKLLQKSYFGKVGMIYIDPPYNTGRDFIYKDNFKNNIRSYLEQTGQIENGVKLTSNPETSGRFHSDWISMMYARIFLSRILLSELGVMFVSIDDNEYHNLKLIMDEIFGEENYISTLVWHKKAGGGGDNKNIVTEHEYVLCYAKDTIDESFNNLELDYDETLNYEGPDAQGRYFTTESLLLRGPNSTKEARPNLCYPIKCPDGTDLLPREGEGAWRCSSKRFEEEKKKDNIIFKQTRNGWMVYYKIYLIDEEGAEKTKKGRTILNSRYNIGQTGEGTNTIKEIFGFRVFDNSKPISLIKHLIKLANSSEIVMDFFAGSGTTAHAVLELNLDELGNRKFICIQMQEPTDEKSLAFKNDFKYISDICKERIRRVIKICEEESKQQKLSTKKLDLGFKVFKLVKSNFKIWENYEGKDEGELKKQFTLFESPLISKYNDEDVIYECIIKEGFSLNSKIDKLSISSNSIFQIIDANKSFYLCLDKEINDQTITKLNISKEDTFICIDAALDNSKKVNLAKQCLLKTL